VTSARFYIIPVLLLLLAGCSRQEKSAETDAALSVQTIDEAGLTQLIEKRNGKILFINVWATWCVPCREEFPDLVRLAEDYRGRAVDFVGISADYPDETESKILPFLKSQKANFPNFVQDFARAENLINMLDSSWSGGLPATFVYNSSGRRQVSHLGKGTFEEFKQMLDEHLP